MKQKKPHSKDWIEDCMKFYGKVLDGEFAHWCYEWDGLPIDETCEEFKCCCCYDQKPTESKMEVIIDKILNSDEKGKNS